MINFIRTLFEELKDLYTQMLQFKCKVQASIHTLVPCAEIMSLLVYMEI